MRSRIPNNSLLFPLSRAFRWCWCRVFDLHVIQLPNTFLHDNRLQPATLAPSSLLLHPHELTPKRHEAVFATWFQPDYIREAM